MQNCITLRAGCSEGGYISDLYYIALQADLVWQCWQENLVAGYSHCNSNSFNHCPSVPGFLYQLIP